MALLCCIQQGCRPNNVPLPILGKPAPLKQDQRDIYQRSRLHLGHCSLRCGMSGPVVFRGRSQSVLLSSLGSSHCSPYPWLRRKDQGPAQNCCRYGPSGINRSVSFRPDSTPDWASLTRPQGKAREISGHRGPRSKLIQGDDGFICEQCSGFWTFEDHRFEFRRGCVTFAPVEKSSGACRAYCR